MAMGKDKSKVNQANVEQSGPLSHKEILIVLSGLMTGMLLAALDQTIVSTALKNIVEDFNGLNHYTWVVTAYLLTSTASTPFIAVNSCMQNSSTISESKYIIPSSSSAMSIFRLFILVYLSLTGVNSCKTRLSPFGKMQGKLK